MYRVYMSLPFTTCQLPQAQEQKHPQDCHHGPVSCTHEIKYKSPVTSQLGPWDFLRFVAVVFFLFPLPFFCSNPHSHRGVFTCLCFHFRIACLCGKQVGSWHKLHGCLLEAALQDTKMLPINLQVLVIMSDFLIFGRFRSKREEHSTNHTTEISRSKLFQMLLHMMLNMMLLHILLHNSCHALNEPRCADMLAAIRGPITVWQHDGCRKLQQNQCLLMASLRS